MIVRLRHFQGPSVEQSVAAMEQIGAEIIPYFADDAPDNA